MNQENKKPKIHETNTAIIKQLQGLLPFGVIPLEEPHNGAKYGIVMQCEEQEVYCVKLQLSDTDHETAEELFHLQHQLIVNSYCHFVYNGFLGAYLATPYLRQRSNGLWETGLANFIFPFRISKYLFKNLGYNPGEIERKKATNMRNLFLSIYFQNMKKQGVDLQYIDATICPRLHLQEISMAFMVVDNNIVCLRANLRMEEDNAWNILSYNRIGDVYHLPSAPYVINKFDLPKCKGLI